jgi:hypothetical protein
MPASMFSATGWRTRLQSRRSLDKADTDGAAILPRGKTADRCACNARFKSQTLQRLRENLAHTLVAIGRREPGIVSLDRRRSIVQYSSDCLNFTWSGFDD